MTIQPHTIFDSNAVNYISDWKVIDDVVMGGRSSGTVHLNNEGNVSFEGHVSLENNGGFSTLKYRFNDVVTKPYSKIVLNIKGDGKRYQFRLKKEVSDNHSYVSYFKTSEDWEVIDFPLVDMYPTFRGRKLDIPNYDGNSIQEVAFLIGNKKAENFKLEIGSIVLK